MSQNLSDNAAQKLCMNLLQAESEDQIIGILDKAGLWNDDSAWRLFGDRENNFSIIGNQQSSPAAAMVEKFVNAVDAVLMRECYLEGLDPESADAPQSIAEALERYFGVKNGNLANVTATERTNFADNIGFVATGRKQTPNYTVFDRGEGQTPDMMPHTLLSLAESNKLRIPFVQGKFNMGGTGVLPFCGRRKFQLIISRRHPGIADSTDPLADYWGFTVVRREPPSQGRRSPMLTYLAPGGAVPRFHSRGIQIPNIGKGGPPPKLEWGTIIKMFEYEMTGFKASILWRFYQKSSLLLPRVGLPIRFYERRYEEGHSFEATMAGLHVRLEEDKRDNLEDGFPAYSEFKVQGQIMGADIYVFRQGRSEAYRDNEGVIFTINGQTHGFLPQSFFTRKAVGMSYLADSILVIVNCDNIAQQAIEDLFMNSRDRLRSGDLQYEIERRLEDIISKHPGLRELRERRRREAIEGRLADSRPLRDVLSEILKKSPYLQALFIEGKDLSNPFKSRLAGEQLEFRGKPHPFYFRLMKKDEHKDCHINLRFRAQFETDVVNDYFGRDRVPGRFKLHVGGRPTEDYVLNLWNGVATLTVALPSDVSVGDELFYEAWVEDDTLIKPFYNTFTRSVIGPHQSQPGPAGKRQPPAGPGEGDRETPSQLRMPKVMEVREEEWEAEGFDRYSALKVVGTGEGDYDFFVNMDNVYLQSEMKALSPNREPQLLEARFKYGMVLIGLALLKERERQMDGDDEKTGEASGVEEQVFAFSKAIAPFLLPMINALSELDLELESEHVMIAG